MRWRYRGQTLVEFALILPLLLAVLLGIIDFAFLVQGYLTVNHAAREAARFAIVYQPPQGECLHRDASGGPVLEPWPNCPEPYAEDAGETDAHYFDRRVSLIKQAALDAADGLRTSQICSTLTCIVDHWTEPGMLGVRVWGFQSFETAEEEDRPGLPGLPVRVEMTHNVSLVVFGTFLPNQLVRVRSSTEMINEGIQVGFGNLAPPTFSPSGPAVPPGTGVATNTPAPGSTPGTPTPGPSPTPTPRPAYNLDLSPQTATNILPDQFEHMLGVKVTGTGKNIAGARVTLVTDEGSFEASGSGSKTTIVETGADGIARPVIRSNAPVTATIHAWLDYNSNGVIDVDEPTDVATKIWQVTGPYLIVSNHNPEPNAVIAVSLMDHPVSQNPYSLWWCPSDPEAVNIVQQLAVSLNVDTLNKLEDVPVQVPLGAFGKYHIRSHSGSGGGTPCATDPVARSAAIEIAEIQPDLVIDAVTLVDPYAVKPGEPITLNITIRNQAPISVTTGPFDLDLFVDPSSPPQVRQLGDAKHWASDLGPLESTVLTATVTIYTVEDHELYAYVDTTNYVDEGTAGGEDNNLFGPVPIVIPDCIPIEGYADDFDGGLGGQWSTHNFANSDGSTSNNGGALEVASKGRGMTDSQNSFYYIYQQYSGDYDARLRILSVPQSNDNARIGLVALNSLNPATDYVANMVRKLGPRVLSFYRDESDVSNISGTNIYLPRWVRIVRIGETYGFYHSPVDEPELGDWTSLGSRTETAGLSYIGIAQASWTTGLAYGRVDDFKLCVPTSYSAVTPPADEIIFPPGLRQCTELLSAAGFEGNAEAVFAYWHAGDRNTLFGAYSRTSAEFYRGSFSFRLHASNSVIPCASNQLQPYLYQEVAFPTDVYTFSTLVVSGAYFVGGSSFECSVPNSPDLGDTLTLGLRQTNGTQITTPQNFINRGLSTNAWHLASFDLHSMLADPSIYAGQTLRLQWEANNDTDINGTFFYMDDVSAQLCTEWDTPDTVMGKAAFGGLITTRGDNDVPVAMPGTDVIAYAQGGDVMQTRSIQDGTYHFYNVDPGTYLIFASVDYGGQLRTATASVTVAADESNFSVNLLLQ